MTALHEEPAHRLAARIRAREVSALEVTEAFLDRLTRLDADNYAFLTAVPEIAVAQATAIDEAIASGKDVGPLAGVPMAIKDNLVTTGVATTAGSRLLQDYVPQYTATVVQRLYDAGAILVGKTNLDEFAMGSSTENSSYYPTRNPHAKERVPGGSSGGSAAAVAAREAAFALGSDTGGSIRQPAAFCGVVGVKPTYGRVSRFGLIAFASSLDQVGPMTGSVRDAALVLAVIAGRDVFDQTSSAEPVPDYLQAIERSDVRGLRFALPPSCLEGVDPDVRAATLKAADELRRLGLEQVEVSLDYDHLALDAYYVIAPSEASSNLARFDGIRYGRAAEAGDLLGHYLATRGSGFGAEVKRRIMLGTFALSSGYYDAYYLTAQKVRTLIRGAYDKAFQTADVILSPTTPTPAFGLGEKVDDPLAMYLSDTLTVPANLAGLPAVSLPASMSGVGLPIGVQLVAPAFAEERLFCVAAALEAALPPAVIAQRGEESHAL